LPVSERLEEPRDPEPSYGRYAVACLPARYGKADPDACSFDASGADYTHDGPLCTFEVLIREFDLGGDPALV